MPLQNRTQPDGEIVAVDQRGLMMGNRGGQIHLAASKTLHTTRRWVSRRWICCVTEFKQRQRAVMSDRTYTELFFLDEVTALAAGHRPCFECRRGDAIAFAEKWQQAHGLNTRPSADQMDEVLHEARLRGREQRVEDRAFGSLPDGAMYTRDDAFFAKKRDRPLSWSFDGYSKGLGLEIKPDAIVTSLTPAPILAALHAGYQPIWHPSAEA